jgi:hypothetical protein
MGASESSALAHSSLKATTPHQEHRHCFCCLEGRVFLGSLEHDGEEIYEVICCRRCKGTARING